jgi:signal transduction histidine kinase
MDLESDKLNGFDELDRYALKMLVDLAVVALKNERQFRMQGERQSRELVAQMATGIIHDVNNLISNIPGVVGELRNELRGSRNDAAIEEYLLDLQNSATQTHRISSRLRDFVVRREFKPISYELGLLIKKVINDLETAKPDHIEIEFIQSPPLHNIQIDPLWVEALFSNLLHNAFEAIPPSRKGRILIKSWLDQNNILATIQDNGNGIPKDLLEKIFQPGFTTKGDPTRLHGIGLYFCQEVVFAHHGQINVQSIPGSETTFTVMFPASENIKEGSSLVQ